MRKLKLLLRLKISHAQNRKAISIYAVHMARAGSPFSAKGQLHRTSFIGILTMIVRPRLPILGTPDNRGFSYSLYNIWDTLKIFLLPTE